MKEQYEEKIKKLESELQQAQGRDSAMSQQELTKLQRENAELNQRVSAICSILWQCWHCVDTKLAIGHLGLMKFLCLSPKRRQLMCVSGLYSTHCYGYIVLNNEYGLALWHHNIQETKQSNSHET